MRMCQCQLRRRNGGQTRGLAFIQCLAVGLPHSNPCDTSLSGHYPLQKVRGQLGVTCIIASRSSSTADRDTQYDLQHAANQSARAAQRRPRVQMQNPAAVLSTYICGSQYTKNSPRHGEAGSRRCQCQEALQKFSTVYTFVAVGPATY